MIFLVSEFSPIQPEFGIFFWTTLIFLIVWLAATLNFFIPRLSGQNPVRERLLEQALLGGYMHAGMKDMVAEYEVRFGLDQPLYVQYWRYLGDLTRLDFNYSIANYPRTVKDMMADALPWTIGLLLTTTLLSFSPRLSTVSIIPGIENFAPERTDTSNGSRASPRVRPIFFSSAATCFLISASMPFGHPPCMYARHASVVMVKPCGTGRLRTLIISARFAPLPPSRSFISIGGRRCL